jgi:hypothetical protein
MKTFRSDHRSSISFQRTASVTLPTRLRRISVLCSLVGVATLSCVSQVITIDSHGNAVSGNSKNSAYVDRRFAQIEPTHVALDHSELDPKTRLEVIRVMQSEQGFAMRPFPKGHRGLTLIANGKLEPAGEAYVSQITAEGTSAKPGDRVVLTDIKIDRSKIIFDLNGGPDRKHRFLRHVQLGTGPNMNPAIQGDDPDPVGARLTLEFQGHIPELTGTQIKALLAPLISFDVKTPVQAFTDTLPPALKKAILDHKVMVGMSIDMVLFAKGQPQKKTREMDGQMPFEEWIYGQPPKDVEFVRINGNRVIRLEIAKVGESPQIFTQNEVEGLMRTDGTPLAPSSTRTIALGDAERDPNKQAAATPPSIRNPGETLPLDDHTGAMKPVRFPKAKPDDSSGADPTQAAPSPAPTKPAATQIDSPDDAHPAPAPAPPPQLNLLNPALM